MRPQEFVNLVESLVDRKIKKPYKLGRIDPSYSSGLPRILFDGETQVSTKRYSYASNYTPIANQRVLLASVGGTYIVLCGVVNS